MSLRPLFRRGGLILRTARFNPLVDIDNIQLAIFPHLSKTVWKADRYANAAINADVVAQADSQAGNYHVFQQNSSGREPVIGSDGTYSTFLDFGTGAGVRKFLESLLTTAAFNFFHNERTWSIAFPILPNNDGVSQAILTNARATGTDTGLFINRNSSNRLEVYLQNGTSSSGRNCTATLTMAQGWQVVILTCNAGALTVEVGSQTPENHTFTVSHATNPATSILRIGAPGNTPASDTYLQSKLAWLLVTNDILTTAEKTKLRNWKPGRTSSHPARILGTFASLGFKSISNCRRWFDFSDKTKMFQTTLASAVPVTAAGDPIGAIRDKATLSNSSSISLGRDAEYDGTAGKRPILLAASANGTLLDLPEFDGASGATDTGADDELVVSGGSDGSSKGAKTQIIVALNKDNAPEANSGSHFGKSGTAYWVETSLYYQNTAALVDKRFVYHGAGTDVLTYGNESSTVTTEPMAGNNVLEIFVLRRDGNQGRVNWNGNNSQRDPQTFNEILQFPGQFGPAQNPGFALKGVLAEWVEYNCFLSDSFITDVIVPGIAAKYGITLTAPAAVQNFSTQFGAIPTPNKSAFHTYRTTAVETRVKQARDIPTKYEYFFSASGSDANNGLTPASPKQTISALNTLLASLAGSSASIRLKRSDKFSGAITFPTTGQFKLGAYGSGAKPIVTLFSSTGYLDADNAWTNDSGNLWHKTVNPATMIGYIREVAAPYNPYTQTSSSANVALIPNSFFQASTTGTFTANSSNEQCSSTSHGLSEGEILTLYTSNTLPGGLATQVSYFVKYIDANTFQLAATSGGAAINITSAGSGTHTWLKAGALYINAGNGVDPNAVDFEVVADRNVVGDGVNRSTTAGDGTHTFYVEDIVCEGHGVSTDTAIIRTAYGIAFAPVGNDLCVAVNCEAYYNGRHCFGSVGTGGGINVFRNCIGGFGSIDATSFVCYSGTGAHEAHFENCICKFAKLPSTTYGDTFGPVYAGGPGLSAFISHTAGGAAKNGFVTVHGMQFQDNRATYPRATYELGGMSSNDNPGTYDDLSSYRVFMNHAPMPRLTEHAAATVTVTAASDLVNYNACPYEDGDVVQFSTTGTIPGGVTAYRPYAVMNKNTNDFQLGSVLINVNSVNASTDTLTCISAHGLVNNDRVKIESRFGQLPGGLSSSTLYYVVGASGSDLQLSLTSGGAAVDITDTGFGGFRIYGKLVDITSAGTGTLTALAIDVSQSAYVSSPQSYPVAFYNCGVTGLEYTPSGGSSSNDLRINEIREVYNIGVSTSVLFAPGSRHFNCHYRLRGRGSFAYLHNGSNANAVLFNSIVDWPVSNLMTGNIYVTNDTAHMRANAYFDPSARLTSLITSDDRKVALSSSPGLGATPISGLLAAGLQSPGGIDVEYDFGYVARNVLAPSIGPIEA